METLKNRKVFFLIAIASIGLLITGLTSELYLGDEVYHYRFARNMFETGKRVSHDPLYKSGTPPGFFYATDPLWEGLLAVLWKTMGKVSFPVAQIYQTCFYAPLLVFIYLIGKEIFGKEEGFWSTFLVATMSMVVAFGVLFYVDLPATAITMMALYWIIRRKYFLAGLTFPAMYLAKRNACFLIPAMLLIPIYFGSEGFLKNLRNLAFLLTPLALIASWDLRWRYEHIENIQFQVKGFGLLRNLSLLEYVKLRANKLILGTKEYLNSSLINPLDLIKYLGVAVILLLMFYFIRGVFKKEKREDRVWVWVTVGSYVIFFLFLFGFNSDIRYLFPIIPLLCLVASRAITSFRQRWVPILILLVCLMQFGGTLVYVHGQRRMPKEIREGFSYISTQIPRDALLLYPEYSLLEATGRRFIWQSFFDVEQQLIMRKYPEYQGDASRIFFWNPNTEDLMRSLSINKVDYIVVKKSRTYDDSIMKHLGGYPKTFYPEDARTSFFKTCL